MLGVEEPGLFFFSFRFVSCCVVLCCVVVSALRFRHFPLGPFWRTSCNQTERKRGYRLLALLHGVAEERLPSFGRKAKGNDLVGDICLLFVVWCFLDQQSGREKKRRMKENMERERKKRETNRPNRGRSLHLGSVSS